MKRKTMLLAGAMTVLVLSCTQFRGQQHPIILASRWDIRTASSDTENIRIPKLPLEDYPLLAKFTNLQHVSFHWNGANDSKLRALSEINFPRLRQIGLLDCPSVTDEGINAVANIPSLRGLGLEGTSITDVGLEIMATKMKLAGANVANCPGVTMKGVMQLANSPTLEELSFSADGWTQEQVVELINSLKNVNWCEVIDPKRRLDAQALERAGRIRNIKVLVRPDGALQGVPRHKAARSTFSIAT